ncbi:TonB-dependent receptor PqqU [Ignavibacteria bacterium]|nr:TonB-dependent receptor [Bacteroidota bacterium]
MNNNLIFRISLAAAAFSIALASASAQQKKQVKDTVYKTSPITVTATRQEAADLSVPLAVTIVPKELMNNRRGYGLDEVLTFVPGVLAQSRAGNHDARIVIRGFGARGSGERSNAGTSRGLRFYLDGIPETEPDGRTAFDLIDIAGASSVEVVRSNASALWGNAGGGIVNISNVPAANDPFIEAQVQAGNFGFLKNSLRAASPTDLGKAFVSFNNTTFDGWRTHSESANTQFNAGLVNNMGARTKFGVFIAGASNIFRIPGPLNQTQFDTDPTQAQNDTLIYKPTYVMRDERRFNRLGRIGTTFEHTLSRSTSVGGTGFLQSKYLQRSERNTFRDFNRYHTGGNFYLKNTMKLSDNLQSNLIVGADEQYQDGAILFYSLVNGGRGTLLQDKREGANNFGIFTQEDMQINEQLNIVIGARYDNITYYSENFLVPGESEDKSFTQITPKFGVTYRITPEHTVYTNFGGGVEVPAGNETDPVPTYGDDTLHVINPLLEPIRSTTIEIGYKTVANADFLGDATVSADVAAYMITIKNDIIPYRGGRFYFTAGETRRLGGELGLGIRWLNGLSLWAAVTLSDNRYVNYKIDSVYYNKSLAGKSADYKDNKAAGLPDFFSTIRLRFEPEFVAGTFIEADMRLMGEYYVDDANTLTVPSYAVFDAAAGYDLKISDALGAKIYARYANLTDARYAASAWINPDMPSKTLPAYIEPGLAGNITAGLTLTWYPGK